MDRFFNHPRTVCMDYITHTCFSLKMAYILANGAIKAVIHAFLPDYYVSSTTDVIKRIEKELEESGCRDSDKSE